MVTTDTALLFFAGCWVFLGIFASYCIDDPPPPRPGCRLGGTVRWLAFAIAWPIYVAADGIRHNDFKMLLPCGGWILAALILTLE